MPVRTPCARTVLHWLATATHANGIVKMHSWTLRTHSDGVVVCSRLGEHTVKTRSAHAGVQDGEVTTTQCRVIVRLPQGAQGTGMCAPRGL
jgi:hypothetical protein